VVDEQELGYYPLELAAIAQLAARDGHQDQRRGLKADGAGIRSLQEEAAHIHRVLVALQASGLQRESEAGFAA
jgi:hypothetical protein